MIAWTFDVIKVSSLKHFSLSLFFFHHPLLSVFLLFSLSSRCFLFSIFLFSDNDYALIATDMNKRWKYNHICIWDMFMWYSQWVSEWIKNRLKYKVNIKIRKNQYTKLQSNKCVQCTHIVYWLKKTGWERKNKKMKKIDDSLCYLWNVNDVLYSICTVYSFFNRFLSNKLISHFSEKKNMSTKKNHIAYVCGMIGKRMCIKVRAG